MAACICGSGVSVCRGRGGMRRRVKDAQLIAEASWTKRQMQRNLARTVSQLQAMMKHMPRAVKAAGPSARHQIR